MKKKFLTLLLTSVLCLTTSLGVCAAETTEVTNNSENNTANIAVEVEVASVFSVGIPTQAQISSETNKGNFQLSIKADLDPRYKLTVVAADGYKAEDGDTTGKTNFLLKDESSTSTFLTKRKTLLWISTRPRRNSSTAN